MNFMSFVKRITPFALTFAVGLFIASFFVTVAAPNFSLRRDNFRRHKQCDRQREMRLQQLEAENDRLQRRVNELESRADWVMGEDINVAIPPPPPPPVGMTPLKTVPSKSR